MRTPWRRARTTSTASTGWSGTSSSPVTCCSASSDPVELTPEQFSRYERESDPVTEDGPDVVRLGDLLAAMERQQAALAEVLASMSVADLQAPHTWGDAEMTLLKRVHFQYFHDSYHTGQTDLLRQISGRSDKII